MDRIVRLRSGLDFRALPLTPQEAFVLTRVGDGIKESEFSRAVGMPPADAERLLSKLEKLGAVEYTLRVATELVEEIERVFADLEGRDHYGLLGVTPEASRREIKSAYYKKALEFHPDKFYGKVGPDLTTKLDSIFARLTLAHDVLIDPKQRAEYDLALGREVLDGDRVSSAPPESMREHMLKKLGVRTAARPRTATVQPAHDPKEKQEAAVQALRDRFVKTKEDYVRRMLDTHLATANDALSKGDLLAASDAYRKAIQVAPDREDLKSMAEQVHVKAIRENSTRFMNNAQEAAKAGNWTDAALGYLKACEGRPADAKVHERAAFALLMAGADPQRALTYAQKAVLLEEENVDYRLSLIKAYMTAGLLQSALTEAERMVKLAPKDARGKDMISQIKAKMAEAKLGTG